MSKNLPQAFHFPTGPLLITRPHFSNKIQLFIKIPKNIKYKTGTPHFMEHVMLKDSLFDGYTTRDYIAFEFKSDTSNCNAKNIGNIKEKNTEEKNAEEKNTDNSNKSILKRIKSFLFTPSITQQTHTFEKHRIQHEKQNLPSTSNLLNKAHQILLNRGDIIGDVEQINLQDLKRFHKEIMRMQNVIFVFGNGKHEENLKDFIEVFLNNKNCNENNSIAKLNNDSKIIEKKKSKLPYTNILQLDNLLKNCQYNPRSYTTTDSVFLTAPGTSDPRFERVVHKINDQNKSNVENNQKKSKELMVFPYQDESLIWIRDHKK